VCLRIRPKEQGSRAFRTGRQGSLVYLGFRGQGGCEELQEMLAVEEQRGVKPAGTGGGGLSMDESSTVPHYDTSTHPFKVRKMP